MEISGCEAIVLSTSDLGEDDRLVTLFTREYGKIRGVARHGRKSVRRFGGALEAFARLRVQLVLREGLSSLRGADIVTLFSGIRADLSRICHAGYACEVVDRLLPEAFGVPRLYRLLNSYLEHLNVSSAVPDDRRFFEINLLNILGYRPSLERCSRCGAEPGKGGGCSCPPLPGNCSAEDAAEAVRSVRSPCSCWGSRLKPAGSAS